ncbi:TetR/AcrR family transcriptional regulator [Fusibacter paucivorans]|uniref:TetR/AcrR family transcriptional regulator n=1 Tax=Fusibacter paucivorans TaxID=76009 RepID=A0ABS5PTR0_9FIRM|nr:TetR/AcrR family transcriptional regulator [Fusibacter paucivorans]
MPNQNYHHGDLKTELIKEGIKLLNSEGYEGVSLRKIAKACGVSQTAPYRHFKNKDDLINAILMEAMQDFSQSLGKPAEEYAADPQKQLKAIGLAYIEFFSKNPDYLKLLFSSDLLDKLNTESQLAFHSKSRHFETGHPFAIFYHAVKNYAASSSENTMSEQELLLYCWGLVHGIAVLLTNTSKLPFEGDYLAIAKSLLESEEFLR